MSELKAHRFITTDELFPEANAGVLYYEKSEADKAIAELEESHKKEVGQLLIEIAELKDKLKNVSGLLNETREWLMESQKMHKRCADNAIKKIRHQKYKRCLAMAKWCRELLRLMRTYEVTDEYWNLEPGQDAEYFCKKGDFYSKWRKRWLELANKFKEGV